MLGSRSKPITRSGVRESYAKVSSVKAMPWPPPMQSVTTPRLIPSRRPMMKASLPDLVGEHRTEAIPPEPYRLVADVDAPLQQNILDQSQRQRIADVHHHRDADHFRRAVETTEGIAHRRRLRNLAKRLKPIYSDNAHACLCVASDLFHLCNGRSATYGSGAVGLAEALASQCDGRAPSLKLGRLASAPRRNSSGPTCSSRQEIRTAPPAKL